MRGKWRARLRIQDEKRQGEKTAVSHVIPFNTAWRTPREKLPLETWLIRTNEATTDAISDVGLRAADEFKPAASAVGFS